MSRGLGTLQQRILATLDLAKQAAPRYRGSGEGVLGSACRGVPLRIDPAGWIWYRDGCVQLADDVYDLRCSAAYLAELSGVSPYIRGPFRAAFCRAVRGLVHRKQLIPLSGVPLRQVDQDYPAGVEWLADGAYLCWHSRQVRFVKR